MKYAFFLVEDPFKDLKKSIHELACMYFCVSSRTQSLVRCSTGLVIVTRSLLTDIDALWRIRQNRCHSGNLNTQWYIILIPFCQLLTIHFRSLALTIWLGRCFEDVDKKGSVSEFINYNAVCRRAPTTLGLSIEIILKGTVFF